jgi:hypothetical protein
LSWFDLSAAIRFGKTEAGVGVEFPYVGPSLVVHLDGSVPVIPFKDKPILVNPP